MEERNIQFNSFPVVPYRVTSEWGWRERYRRWHYGIDLGQDWSKTETDILAVKKGVVEEIKHSNSRGYYVTIDHGDAWYTRYQHLKEGSILVAKEDVVYAGQKIATMGETGEGSGVHLHFEVLDGGLIYKVHEVDPSKFLQVIVPAMDEKEAKEIIRNTITESTDQPSAWVAEYWDKAIELGITTGETPQAIPTREQVIAMVMRAMPYLTGSQSVE